MPNDIKAVQKQTASYDLLNRLHSIASDCKFVEAIAAKYGRFDVIANQRCGTWYCPSSAYAYFKSTDGHTGNWGFNMRRSNLSLAEMAEKKGGIILVDSTRRGKRMPDALSKTVPIWCTVINRAIAKRWGKDWDCELYTPPNIVSASEKDQIEERLDAWADALESSTLPLPNLNRPLRPFWVHPSTTQIPQIPTSPPYTPIICLSASRWVGSEDDVPSVTKLGRRTVGFSYVPGAGDDDEHWAKGLTPAMFHANKVDLLEAERDELGELVEGYWMDDMCNRMEIGEEMVGVPGPSSKLALSIGKPISSASWTQPSKIHTIRIAVVEKPKKGESPIYRSSSTTIFACPSPRSHPGAYTHSLESLVNHVEDILDEKASIVLRPGNTDHLKAAEDSEEEDPGDIALSPSLAIEARRSIIPLALVLLLSIPDLGGELDLGKGLVDKGKIADMLHQLVALWPDGNPPRAALKRVNEYLMSKRG